MTEPKEPKDRKRSKDELAVFEFEHRGESYRFEGSFKHLTKPGFIRKNRHKDEVDVLFTLLEDIAGDEALDAIDDMEPNEFEEFTKSLNAAIEEYQGE